MRILWLSNIKIPIVCEVLGDINVPRGGWMTYFSERLIEDKNFQMTFVFPDSQECMIVKDNMSFYGFRSNAMVAKFEEIVSNDKPDIIHIWGTEYPQTWAMMQAAMKQNRSEYVVISIQGLVSVIAIHYTTSFSWHIRHMYTPRDLIKGNIARCEKEYRKRGRDEINAIKSTRHIIGRTDLDRACTIKINPNASYHFCNEVLRSSFYENGWSLQRVERYSIFITQCHSPIKGFHIALDAMVDIVKRYPKAKLYTTGVDILHLSFNGLKHLTSYQLYIRHLIKKYGLENNVIFLGTLSEEKMCAQFLMSHVFVLASTIENSPNSLGEAMLLGVPTVASDVGGVKNMLTHDKDGFVYQHDAPYMLAYYVMRIFEDDALAMSISESAQLHAKCTHDRDENYGTLLKIYGDIAGN
jgi:glycosyltransferase involved in cell wall biosynthesis